MTSDYDDYILQDLNSRVFIDFELFIKTTLHVPDDWRTRWGPAIDAIKADAKFNEYHEKYCGLCEEGGTPEDFNTYFMETANAAVGVLSRSDFKDIPLEERQRYRDSGSTQRFPGIIFLNADRRDPCPGENKNPLHTVHVSPHGNVLCDGRNVSRYSIDGKRAIRPFRG